MDTILDTPKVFLSSVWFRLLLDDVAWGGKLFCSCRVISLAYYFGQIVPVTAIMGEIILLFSAMDNSLMRTSGH